MPENYLPSVIYVLSGLTPVETNVLVLPVLCFGIQNHVVLVHSK